MWRHWLAGARRRSHAGPLRLVTHGRVDTIVLASMAEHVLDVCRTARAAWYEGVGHAPFLKASARFDRELREFAGEVR